MRRIIFIAFFHLCCSHVTAQVNYVLNPSLELHDSCPTDIDQIRYALFWNALDSTLDVNYGRPEYCNVCDTYSSSPIQLPINYFFNHYPRTGSGMAQVGMYTNIMMYYDGRDYLQGRLYKPLTSGKSYCVSFYVCLEKISKYAINHIGAYFDNASIDTTVNPGTVQTEYIPQILENSVITDSVNWIKIDGSFTANGTERFITIGNFLDTPNTTHIQLNNNFNPVTYYLLDDISVIESNHVAFAGNDTTIQLGDSIFLGEIAVPYVWYDGQGHILDSTSGGIWVHSLLGSNKYVVKQTLCGAVTWDSVTVTVAPAGVKNISYNNNFSVYPNPSNGTFTISGNINGKDVSIEILNTLGQVVYKETKESTNGKLNKQISVHLPSGVYTIYIKDSGNIPYIRRLVID